MNRLWSQTIGAIFLASTLLCFFSMIGLENDDSVDKPETRNVSLAMKADKRRVDPEEYERFLDSLYATETIRHRFFERLKPANAKTASSSQSSDLVKSKPSILSVTYRNFNFHTGEQQEDKFDCDLLLLTKEEASLLEKVKKIENIGDSMQDEVLEICQSIDNEFHVICRYAEKCEQEMGNDAYTVLKYVISSNNETIMSCHAKESEWIGFGSPNQIDDDSGDEWLDEHGVPVNRYHRIYKAQPCISQAQVYQCFFDHFGALQFDLSRQSISNEDHCYALHRFDRCIKRFIFEEASHNCTLEEKETSLEILRGMFVFELPQGDEKENEDTDVQMAKCRATRDLWSQSNYASVKKVLREKDNAFRYTETLRSGYQLLKNDDCYARTVVDDELCLQRFEEKVRRLWNSQAVDNHKTLENEITIMCCLTAELSACLSTFVLIRCGLEEFSPYQNRVEFLRLASMPEECALLPYSSHQCQSII